MGIKGLEGYIKFHRQISETISIPERIKRWTIKNRNVPTILVDLKEFARIVIQFDEEGYILGGRFDFINKLCNYFFGEIKKSGANLVFFCELNEGRFRNIEQFAKNDAVFNCIENGSSLKSFLNNVREGEWGSSNLRPNERITFNLITLCKRYGRVFCSYGMNKEHILAYSRQSHHNVKALITRDTEYLVYRGDFEFWTLSNVDLCELKITRINRRNLYDCMDVNIEQMQLLCALSQFKKEERGRICGTKGSLESCIPYVKRQWCGPHGFGNQIEEELEKLVKIDRYAGSWTADEYVEPLSNVIECHSDFESVVNFCQNNFYFAYKLMNETITIQKDLRFIDLRRSDSGRFLDVVANTTLKLCGVVFMDIDSSTRPISRTVYLKTGITAAPVERDIIYPPSSLNLPNVKDLIVNNQKEECEQLIEKRWSLFQWLTGLNAQAISKIKLSSDSEHNRLVSFTLDFLEENRLIAKPYAEVIFKLDGITEFDDQETESEHQARVRPSQDEVDIDCVLTAHKYTIAFELICHCLEMCGLRDETSLLSFNALEFHKKMLAKMLAHGGTAIAINQKKYLAINTFPGTKFNTLRNSK